MHLHRKGCVKDGSTNAKKRNATRSTVRIIRPNRALPGGKEDGVRKISIYTWRDEHEPFSLSQPNNCQGLVVWDLVLMLMSTSTRHDDTARHTPRQVPCPRLCVGMWPPACRLSLQFGDCLACPRKAVGMAPIRRVFFSEKLIAALTF